MVFSVRLEDLLSPPAYSLVSLAFQQDSGAFIPSCDTTAQFCRRILSFMKCTKLLYSLRKAKVLRVLCHSVLWVLDSVYPELCLPLSEMLGLCVLWFLVTMSLTIATVCLDLIHQCCPVSDGVAAIQALQFRQLQLRWQEGYSDPLWTGVSSSPGQGRAGNCITKYYFSLKSGAWCLSPWNTEIQKYSSTNHVGYIVTVQSFENMFIFFGCI